MESQPQNPEFRNNHETFIRATVKINSEFTEMNSME